MSQKGNNQGTILDQQKKEYNTTVSAGTVEELKALGYVDVHWFGGARQNNKLLSFAKKTENAVAILESGSYIGFYVKNSIVEDYRNRPNGFKRFFAGLKFWS